MAPLYQKIMVPLDGSDFAATALPHAQEIARRFDAEVVLFQAIQAMPRYVAAGDAGAATIALDIQPEGETIQHEIETVKRGLEQVADGLRKQGIKTQTVTVVGPAADQIVDSAAEQKIDLIVMSTHGRTGLARWAFGSVATKVIQAARCPVLTVRPQAN
jgi:nucleotide-binding universal stress UspA family protein